MLADEYGASPAYFRELPSREFKAHMAIIEGKNKERSKRQKDMKRKRKKAKRGGR